MSGTWYSSGIRSSHGGHGGPVCKAVITVSHQTVVCNGRRVGLGGAQSRPGHSF